MSDRQGHPEPEDCWLYYCVSLKEEYRTEEGQIRIHPSLPIEGVVSADLTDPDVFLCGSRNRINGENAPRTQRVL